VTAMERLAVRAPMPPVVRFVDGLVVAVERGTPLGDVLRAQAADVREQHKRDLIEAGGRREVLMLVPSSIGLANAVDLLKRYRTVEAGPWRGRSADGAGVVDPFPCLGRDPGYRPREGRPPWSGPRRGHRWSSGYPEAAGVI
jgi:hypothetical protein